MAVEVQVINPEHPHRRLLVHAARTLSAGGVVVYPTDTIYGLGADLFHKGALERILRIKKVTKHKLLSFICPDLKDIARWANVPDYAYRIMRRITPENTRSCCAPRARCRGCCCKNERRWASVFPIRPWRWGWRWSWAIRCFQPACPWMMTTTPPIPRISPAVSGTMWI